MSFKVDPKEQFVRVPSSVLFSGKAIKPIDFWVLCIIAYYNPAFPSYKTLMQATGTGSLSTIAASIRRLEKTGLLTVERSRSRGLSRNNYTINSQAAKGGENSKLMQVVIKIRQHEMAMPEDIAEANQALGQYNKGQGVPYAETIKDLSRILDKVEAKGFEIVADNKKMSDF